MQDQSTPASIRNHKIAAAAQNEQRQLATFGKRHRLHNVMGSRCIDEKACFAPYTERSKWRQWHVFANVDSRRHNGGSFQIYAGGAAPQRVIANGPERTLRVAAPLVQW